MNVYKYTNAYIAIYIFFYVLLNYVAVNDKIYYLYGINKIWNKINWNRLWYSSLDNVRNDFSMTKISAGRAGMIVGKSELQNPETTTPVSTDSCLMNKNKRAHKLWMQEDKRAWFSV